MAEKSKKGSNKNTIIGIIVGILVVAAVCVGIFFLVKNQSSVSTNYFVTDDTKYVLELEGNMIAMESEDNVPVKYYQVFTYSDETVTGMKIYYEYKDHAAAEAAYEEISRVYGENEEVAEIVVDGKYVVLTAAESEYSEMSVEEVKQYIDFMQAMSEFNLDDVSEDDVEEIEDADEDEE